jgi:hypothetical protein
MRWAKCCEKSETIPTQRSTARHFSATKLLDDHADDCPDIRIRIRVSACPRVVSVVSLRLAI